MGFLTKKILTKKTDSSNDFMQMVGSAKKEVQATLETNIETFEQSFQNTVKLLSEFSRSMDPKILKMTAEQFLNLIKQKPSRVEPYVYTAYILYLYDQKDEARKYIKLSESIDSNYKFIKDVKALVYS